MIDIHCHILPELDDGSKDIEISLEMLKMAENDGIRKIVASPHFRYKEDPSFDQITDRLAQLSIIAKEKGFSVDLLSGADIRLTYELFEAIEKKEIPTINKSRYFLLELPDLIPPHLEDFIFEAVLKGYVPIITHPERNYTLLSHPEIAHPLREAGALFQITSSSLTGVFGRKIADYSASLVKKGIADFVATDAHGTNRRKPVLSDAYEKVSKLVDADRLKKIFFDNPAAVIGDEELGSLR